MITGGVLQVKQDLADQIQRCFIGLQKKKFLKNSIPTNQPLQQTERIGLKFGMMFSWNTIKRQKGTTNL